MATEIHDNTDNIEKSDVFRNLINQTFKGQYIREESLQNMFPCDFIQVEDQSEIRDLFAKLAAILPSKHEVCEVYPFEI